MNAVMQAPLLGQPLLMAPPVMTPVMMAPVHRQPVVQHTAQLQGRPLVPDTGFVAPQPGPSGPRGPRQANAPSQIQNATQPSAVGIVRPVQSSPAAAKSAMPTVEPVKPVVTKAVSTAQKTVTRKAAPARKSTGLKQPTVTSAPSATLSVQSVNKRVTVQNKCTSSIPVAPVLRRGYGPEKELPAIKQRLGLKPNNTVIRGQPFQSMASPEFYWNGYRRTIRFGARPYGASLYPMQMVQSSSASTWILKDDGLIECSDGIWSIGMDVEDGVCSVNMTESTVSTLSTETPDEDAIVNVTARPKRRRTRRKRNKRVCTK